MKKFVIIGKNCYNIIFIEASNKEEALKKAEKFMININKFFSNVNINDVHEIKTTDKKEIVIYISTTKTKLIQSEIK